MSNKWCVVPQCTNTSIRTPEKLFLSIPTVANIRRKWLQLARRNPNDIVVTSNVFICEDHFDMEKDIINYNKFKMGFSKRLLIAPGAMPSKFYCQENRKKRTCEASTSSAANTKRKRANLIQERLKDTQSTAGNVIATDQDNDNEMQNEIISQIKEPLPTYCDRGTATAPIITAEKSVQVNLKMH